MKKLMMLILSAVFVIVVSGCGGGSSNNEITSVDILDLNSGYLVTGLNDGNDIVEVEFCGNFFDEYINYVHNISGTYQVNDVYVDFYYIGDNAYAYYIDTTPTEYNFLVGDIYNIYDDLDELIDTLEITSIQLIDCNN